MPVSDTLRTSAANQRLALVGAVLLALALCVSGASPARAAGGPVAYPPHISLPS